MVRHYALWAQAVAFAHNQYPVAADPARSYFAYCSPRCLRQCERCHPGQILTNSRIVGTILTHPDPFSSSFNRHPSVETNARTASLCPERAAKCRGMRKSIPGASAFTGVPASSNNCTISESPVALHALCNGKSPLRQNACGSAPAFRSDRAIATERREEALPATMDKGERPSDNRSSLGSASAAKSW